MPIVSTPRSLDLAHLRTALWFHEREPLSRFVSLDTAQTQAARELGRRFIGVTRLGDNLGPTWVTVARRKPGNGTLRPLI